MIDMSALGIQMPQEWGTASDVATNFAQGNATPVPGTWTTGQNWAKEMEKTGMPTSYEPWYQQAKGVAQTDIMDAIKQASEQAGLQGMRWSTPLGRSAQDIAGRRMGELGAQWTQQELGAQEAARQRQMQANQMLYQYGQGTSQLGESSRNRALEATGQLGNLGNMMTQYPMQLSQLAYQMGTGMQGQNQNALNTIYQDWLRQVPENSPWLKYLTGLVGSPQSGPQQYTQGAGSSILSTLSSILPFLFM